MVNQHSPPQTPPFQIRIANRVAITIVTLDFAEAEILLIAIADGIAVGGIVFDFSETGVLAVAVIDRVAVARLIFCGA